MRDFVFENKTKIYFGKEQMCHLHEEVARFGKRVLMVYGGGSIKKIGLYDKIMTELQKGGATRIRTARCGAESPSSPY